VVKSEHLYRHSANRGEVEKTGGNGSTIKGRKHKKYRCCDPKIAAEAGGQGRSLRRKSMEDRRIVRTHRRDGGSARGKKKHSATGGGVFFPLGDWHLNSSSNQKKKQQK